MSDTIDLLLSRRSVPPFALHEPGPTEDQIRTLLTIASRVPDHGKLAPWRFILVQGDDRAALADRLAEIALADPSADAQRIAEDKKRFATPLIVIVVSRAAAHVKIPEWEQVLSAGAVCMNLITAAHSLGFAANWLTGRAAYDPSAAPALGLVEGERVAGFIHIGTPEAPMPDRPRPPLEEIVTRWSAP
ncbi:nitroreductase [Terrihabitans rhizophilus]|uniref:Putative NAD(P)H nitroreductase n=1 Tax=Terrihabitans rhizophilus TaxID=3092662 RepID=A0ABU4RSK2_9HYPH|nr:nitroreductase [Terrihabitans sp. PJ23]MDX6807596.1 nitroreductase [Terrihabitans sp. PJ23]